MVFDRDADDLIGYLVDINTEGMMIISGDPIENNTTYHLRMVFPARVAGERQLDFDAKSIWSREDIKPGYYHAGFEMLNLSQMQVETIEQLIAEFGTRE